MNGAGYIYIMTNPSFKEDWVKIEVSYQETVSSTGFELDDKVPLHYCVFATLKIEEYMKAIEILSEYKRQCMLEKKNSGSFFNSMPQQSLEALCDIAYIKHVSMEISIYEGYYTHVFSFCRGIQYLFSFFDELKEEDCNHGDDYDDEPFFGFGDDFYRGWSNRELLDACDAAYEGHSRLELGLD